jgi:hypothetical protein
LGGGRFTKAGSKAKNDDFEDDEDYGDGNFEND